MVDFGLVAVGRQQTGKLIGDHDGTMPSARASDGDGEIALTLDDIIREKKQ
jgi:hypothetical protein